jgi:phage terminase small subunit
MSPPSHIPSHGTIDEARAQLSNRAPGIVVEALAHQIETLREATRRVAEEGVVVRDMRGAVVPHPAIEVARLATREIAALVGKWPARSIASDAGSRGRGSRPEVSPGEG